MALLLSLEKLNFHNLEDQRIHSKWMLYCVYIYIFFKIGPAPEYAIRPINLFKMNSYICWDYDACQILSKAEDLKACMTLESAPSLTAVIFPALRFGLIITEIKLLIIRLISPPCPKERVEIPKYGGQKKHKWCQVCRMIRSETWMQCPL